MARGKRYSRPVTVDIEIKRRQARFRAQRRGFRELDLIFGALAEKHLNRFDEGQLERLEALLAVPDWQLYGWIMGQEAVPKAFDTDVFTLLRNYKPDPPSR